MKSLCVRRISEEKNNNLQDRSQGSSRRKDAEWVPKYSNVLTMLSPFGLFRGALSNIWRWVSWKSPGYSQLAKSVCVNWFSIVLPSSLTTDELTLSSKLELFCCAINFPCVFFSRSNCFAISGYLFSTGVLAWDMFLYRSKSAQVIVDLFGVT